MRDRYCSFVNLDHRTDRLAHMTSQLERIGMKAERTRGLSWKEVECRPEDIQTMLNRTPGAIGCHFSQVSVMQKALELGKDALVMEDDIVFCNDFNKRMEYIDEWCSKNEWDVFYLGSAVHISDKDAPYWHPIGPSKMGGCRNVSANLAHDAKRTDDPRIIQTFGAFDTFAYLVNKDSLRKVLDMLNQFLPHSIGIDYNMIYWQPRGMKSFAFLPGLVRQMTNQSDIGNGITDWDNFLKLGPYVYQENMENFDPSTFNFGVCEK